MPIVESELALLRHPRLAALATSAWPAWLWSADGSRILWANAVGAAIFGAANASACTQRRFDTHTTRPPPRSSALPRRCRRRPRNGLNGCAASAPASAVRSHALARASSSDGKGAVLIAAAEPAGPALTLAERVRRLFADGDGACCGFRAPTARWSYASAAAQTLLAGATTLSALGIEALAAHGARYRNAPPRHGKTKRGGYCRFDCRRGARSAKRHRRVPMLTLARSDPAANRRRA